MRLRAAVEDRHLSAVVDIARACWDSGYTAHCRRGGKGAP